MNDCSATIEPTHVAWADETHHNTGRYRGIGMVSMPWEHRYTQQAKIAALIEDSNTKEFKWQKLRNAKYKSVADKLIEYGISQASQETLRIDVLIWDTYDERHTLQGRDDMANLQRMYYHLFHNVLRKRWSGRNHWRLHPDEQTSINWKELSDILHRTGSRAYPQQNLFDFAERLKQFDIERIVPCNSQDELFVQLADLFVGLGVYSRNEYSEYVKWKIHNSGQMSFLDEQISTSSNSERVRYEVLSRFERLCSNYGFSFDLDKDKGLDTKNPRDWLNFWRYTPQHRKDKAPVRRNK